MIADLFEIDLPIIRRTFSVLRDEPAFTVGAGVHVLWGF